MIYLCQLGRHLLIGNLKQGYMSTTLKNWIVTLKLIELEPGKLFVLTVVRWGDLIVVNVFIYLFYCYLFFKYIFLIIGGSPRWDLESVRVPPHRLIVSCLFVFL